MCCLGEGPVNGRGCAQPRGSESLGEIGQSHCSAAQACGVGPDTGSLQAPSIPHGSWCSAPKDCPLPQKAFLTSVSQLAHPQILLEQDILTATCRPALTINTQSTIHHGLLQTAPRPRGVPVPCAACSGVCEVPEWRASVTSATPPPLQAAKYKDQLRAQTQSPCADYVLLAPGRRPVEPPRRFQPVRPSNLTQKMVSTHCRQRFTCHAQQHPAEGGTRLLASETGLPDGGSKEQAHEKYRASLVSSHLVLTDTNLLMACNA